RRNREAVLALGIGRVFGLLDDRVSLFELRIPEERAADRDRGAYDSLAALLIKNLAGVVERLLLRWIFLLWLFLGRRVFLVLRGSTGIETNGGCGAKDEQSGQRNDQVPAAGAAAFERLAMIQQH